VGLYVGRNAGFGRRLGNQLANGTCMYIVL